MVQSIQCYLDGAGGIHRSAADAHRADLQQWLQATGSVNEASAAALSRLVVDNRETLFELVSMLEAVARDTRPETETCEATVAKALVSAIANRQAAQLNRRLA